MDQGWRRSPRFRRFLDDPGLQAGELPAQIGDLVGGLDHERRRERIGDRRRRAPVFPGDRHPRRRSTRAREAGARVQDVVALAHARRAEGPAARRDPGQDPAVPGRAQGQGPPLPVRGRLQGQDRAVPPVHERAGDLPLFQHLRHAVDRVALADAAEVEAGSSFPRVDGELVGVELEALQPRPDRGVEGPAGQAVDVPRDLQALHRPRAHPGGLPRGQVIDPRDVAVLDEPAQQLLEPVDELEGGLRGLGGVSRVGVSAVDLEHRGHRRVREAVRPRAREGLRQAEGRAPFGCHSGEPARNSSQSVRVA